MPLANTFELVSKVQLTDQQISGILFADKKTGTSEYVKPIRVSEWLFSVKENDTPATNPSAAAGAAGGAGGTAPAVFRRSWRNRYIRMLLSAGDDFAQFSNRGLTDLIQLICEYATAPRVVRVHRYLLDGDNKREWAEGIALGSDEDTATALQEAMNPATHLMCPPGATDIERQSQSGATIDSHHPITPRDSWDDGTTHVMTCRVSTVLPLGSETYRFWYGHTRVYPLTIPSTPGKVDMKQWRTAASYAMGFIQHMCVDLWAPGSAWPLPSLDPLPAAPIDFSTFSIPDPLLAASAPELNALPVTALLRSDQIKQLTAQHVSTQYDGALGSLGAAHFRIVYEKLASMSITHRHPLSIVS